MRALGIGLAVMVALVAVAARASADRAIATASPDPAIARLSRALPRGWSMTVSAKGDLVIRRDRAVRIAGRHQDNAPSHANIPVHAVDGPEIVLALRYRVEPKWSERKLADARATNAKIYAELAGLRARFKIDEIPTSKGRPLPATPDDEHRLAEFERAEQQARARLIRLPRCTLGASSLFDSPETYAQLQLIVEPPFAMREAFAVVELVKRRCGDT